MASLLNPVGPAPTLSVEQLSVSYATPRGRLQAVRDISFSIAPGQTFGLIGESGSGKSTVAFAVMGYLLNGRIESGQVRFRGRDLLGLDRRALEALRGRSIAMVYQDPQSALNPSIQVGEQVAEAVRRLGPFPSREVRERTLALFEQVNLPDPAALVGRYPHQLSGGQQQRIVIAMALAGNPELLVMDEPTTGLDVTTEARILDLVAELKGRLSASILYISHSLGVIARVCDQIGVMYASRLVETGAVRDVFRNPRHPYTVGLLNCLPRLGVGQARVRLQAIPGGLPDLTRVPAGCNFAPRCGDARPDCVEHEPELLTVESGHTSRCHYWPDIATDPPTILPEIGQSGRRETEDAGARRPLLELVDLRKYYQESAGFLSLGSGGEVRAIDGVSLELRAGETLAVVGESGCGKTTLARCVVGLVAPSAGLLNFEQARLSAGGRDRELHRQIQMVFQSPDATLNPRRTIGEAVARPLQMFKGIRGSELRQRAAELLRSVRLSERYLDRLPKELSGGEKQRVAIARAFAAEPRLVVCDEPVSALDVSVQAAVLNLLADLQREHGTAYLFISHDLSVVQHLADRVAIVYLGKLMELGNKDEIFAPPHHPYTEALLSAIPRPDPDAAEERIRLDGPVPSPANPPSGCVFQTRCPRKLGAICEQQAPPLQQAAEGHLIACHIPLDQLAVPGRQVAR